MGCCGQSSLNIDEQKNKYSAEVKGTEVPIVEDPDKAKKNIENAKKANENIETTKFETKENAINIESKENTNNKLNEKKEDEIKKKQEEERIKNEKEEEEKRKKKEEERIKEEEEEKKKKEEEEKRKKKEEEEKKKKEEEEKKKKEEEEKKKKEEEEKRKKKEEEEKKKKEEEEKKKKEEEGKKNEEEEINNKIQKEIEIEYQKLKEEELSKILPSDFEKPSKSCIFLGVYGNFLTDKERALERINNIRKEACEEGVKDPESNKKFTPSDYKPLKWSTELEYIARIRAFESCLTIGHSRLNGKEIWSVEKKGIRSWGENLAWNWENANSIDMINQWYAEKDDWVNGGKGVTGHYESLISSRFNYVGLGWFQTKCSKYPFCLAGAFSMNGNEEDFIEEKRDIIQTLDILRNKIDSYYLEGKKIMKTNESQILTPRIKLKNPALSVWPLKRYDLSYISNNPKIAQVYKTGKVKAFKQGNVIITCKNPDKSIFANFNIDVKCSHEKKLIKTVDATCTKTGTNTFLCEICNSKLDSKINIKPHDFKFINSKGKSIGTCTKCKKVIQCNPPSMFDIYWRNNQTTEGSSYWSVVPGDNPIWFLYSRLGPSNKW